jgi:hypothetical protein
VVGLAGSQPTVNSFVDYAVQERDSHCANMTAAIMQAYDAGFTDRSVAKDGETNENRLEQLGSKYMRIEIHALKTVSVDHSVVAIRPEVAEHWTGSHVRPRGGNFDYLLRTVWVRHWGDASRESKIRTIFGVPSLIWHSDNLGPL